MCFRKENLVALSGGTSLSLLEVNPPQNCKIDRLTTSLEQNVMFTRFLDLTEDERFLVVGYQNRADVIKLQGGAEPGDREVVGSVLWPHENSVGFTVDTVHSRLLRLGTHGEVQSVGLASVLEDSPPATTPDLVLLEGRWSMLCYAQREERLYLVSQEGQLYLAELSEAGVIVEIEEVGPFFKPFLC